MHANGNSREKGIKSWEVITCVYQIIVYSMKAILSLTLYR